MILIFVSASGMVSLAYVGHPRGQPCHDYASCAFSSYQVVIRKYYLPGYGLYSGRGIGMVFNGFWQTSQIAEAANYLALLKGAPGFDAAQEMERNYRAMQLYLNPNGGYDSAAPVPPSSAGVEYYDDNAWALLVLLQYYMNSHNSTYLQRAESLFDFEVIGWASNSSLPDPGGLYWVSGSNPYRGRNTCANGPAAEAAAELYMLTGKTYYLEWAEKFYLWTVKYLRSPDGLYYDHLNVVQQHGEGGSLSVRVDQTLWSYNQGTMIGAGALLYRATGNDTFLREAEQTAQASLAYFGSRLLAQPIIFNAIWFRNMVRLAEIRPNSTRDAATMELMRGYAETLLQNYVSEDGLFMAPGSTDVPSPNVEPDSVGTQANAAMTQIFALLAGAKPSIPPSPLGQGRPFVYSGQEIFEI